MKKVAVLFLIALSVCALAACGSATPTDLTGTTYKMTGGEIDGQELGGAEVSAILGEITYEFKADGVVSTNMVGEVVDGTWAVNGTTVTITIYGSSTDGTLSGDQMTFAVEGGHFSFTKQ